MVIFLNLILFFSNLFVSDNLIIKECENYFFQKNRDLPSSYICVKIKNQKLYYIEEKNIKYIYPISSSEKGVGNKNGSNKTPLGIHEIKSKIGDNAPIYARFIGRKLTGEIIEIISDTSKGDYDIISTRIMWLSGKENGVNKGDGIDSFKRYIYIHGTNEEGRIGIPSSHGCIRMKNNDIISLFNIVSIGTLVIIINWSLEYIILTVLILGFSLIYFGRKTNSNNQSKEVLIRLNSELRKEIQEIRKEVSQNSEKSRLEIESKLTDINKGIYFFQQNTKEDMQKQFASSNKVIKEVTSELEKIKGTNEQVLGFANQMKTLEKILNNQKSRGILGEIQLENLLSNVLPPELFQMQYSFNGGDTVDAIVKVGEFIIPIDAKFSLDNYNKMIESENKTEIVALQKKFKEDIKKRIDETSKYIKPNQKTTDYAYMFIPADGLYQDLLNSRVGTLKINSKDLVSYAYSKKVMIVSPMSLFPMLQITVKALHNLKVEESIEDILKNMEKLRSHMNSYADTHHSLGKTIGTVVNHYNKTSKEFNKVKKDISNITNGTTKIEFEPNLVEKPYLDE